MSREVVRTLRLSRFSTFGRTSKMSFLTPPIAYWLDKSLADRLLRSAKYNKPDNERITNSMVQTLNS